MFSGCLFAAFVYSSVCLSKQISLPQYRMSGLSSFDKTTENIHELLLMTWLDFRGQRSSSQQPIEVANASMSTLWHRSPSCS